MEWKIENNHSIIDLGNSLEFKHLQAADLILKETMIRGLPIIFKCDQLAYIDTPSIQLLLVFIIAANQRNIHCEFVNASSEFIHLAKLIGADSLLKLSGCLA